MKRHLQPQSLDLVPIEIAYYQAQIRIANLNAKESKLEIALLDKKLSET